MFHPLVHSPVVARVETEPPEAGKQELHRGLLCKRQGLKSVCSQQDIGSKQRGSVLNWHSDMGCQQLNPLCHSIGPKNALFILNTNHLGL